MKKRILFLLVFFITLYSVISLANNTELIIKPDKTKLKPEEEVTFLVSMSKEIKEGNQNAVQLTLQYDQEMLQFKNIEWQNNWTGIISRDKTGIVATKEVDMNEDQGIFKITYIVKKDAKSRRTKVNAKNIIISIDNNEIKCDDIETAVKIKGGNLFIIIIISIVIIIAIIILLKKIKK